MHDRCCFPGEIDSGSFFQSELLKIFVIIVYTKTQSYGDQCRITTILHTLHKCLCAMSADLMAADLSVVHNDESRTGKGTFRGDHPFLQSRRGCNDLKGRSRFIGIIDAAVAPHGI